MEATDAKELIDQAIERVEIQRDVEENAERAQQRRFSDRVSILVGIFAAGLAVIHMAAAGSARESLLKGIAASDSFAYMQAKVMRETVLKTAIALGGTPADKTSWAAEAHRLRAPDRNEHGIGQLQKKGEEERRDAERAAIAGEGYELGETALQMAIVLLSLALIARSYPIAFGACLLALSGAGLAIAAKADVMLPWIA